MKKDPDLDDRDNVVKPLPSNVIRMFRELEKDMVKMRSSTVKALDVEEWDKRLEIEQRRMNEQLERVKKQAEKQQEVSRRQKEQAEEAHKREQEQGLEAEQEADRERAKASRLQQEVLRRQKEQADEADQRLKAMSTHVGTF